MAIPQTRAHAAVLTGPAGDLMLGAAVIAVTAIAVVLSGGQSFWGAAAAVCVLGCASLCAAAARSRAMTSALLMGVVLFASGWLTGMSASIATGVVLVPVFVLVYRAATRTTLGWALVATVVLVAGWQGGAFWADGSGAFNPSYFFVPVGACVVGMLVRARVRATENLAAQTRELLAAQQQYTQESVRAERVRIARELHDIVAHCVSAMVVQANAGHKLATRDPALAAEAFGHITGSARQASTEITRLVALLEPEFDQTAQRTRSIDELVAHARDAGLAVVYRPPATSGPLDADVTDVAYAVVQEALTNALKHAPGAPVDVRVCSTPERVSIIVSNTAARTAGLGLADAGGQHGLTGLRERVAGCGGTLVAGPDLHGGWRVAAHLPATGD